MFRSKYSTRRQSARAEATASPVFVVLERFAKSVKIVAAREAFLTRQEGEAYVAARQHRPEFQRAIVFAVPAVGELATALSDDAAEHAAEVADLLERLRGSGCDAWDVDGGCRGRWPTSRARWCLCCRACELERRRVAGVKS